MDQPETRHSLIVRLKSDDYERAWFDFVAVYEPFLRHLVTRLGVTSPPWSKEAAGRERVEVETRKRGLVEPRPRKRRDEDERQ